MKIRKSKYPLPCVGDRFGRLTVVAIQETRTYDIMIDCQCDCDKSTTVSRSSLVRGMTKSCGCLRTEKGTGRTPIKHGHCRNSGGNKRTAEWQAWQSMMARCYSGGHQYRQYAARGTQVSAKWRASFEAFLADVGPRPSAEYSLDRIDNEGHYEPGNCRWATRSEQATNRSTARFLEAFGERLTEAAWCRRLGITRGAISLRLARGYTVERAVSEPSHKGGPS